MAQKPRSQDNYQPGLVSATPTIQAIGGTNQAVVPSIPKDNTYLRLSRSLSQFSNLLGQVSNINQQRGLDVAKGLSAEELDDIITGKIPDPEGGPLGALGFQKAFQQASAKRWYETVGVQKYADLENTIDAKLDDYIKNGYDINKAKALVQEDVGALSTEIQEYFADKEWGGQVSNLLGGELSSRVMAGALKGYEKKQKAYLQALEVEEINNNLGKWANGEIQGTFEDIIKQTESDAKNAGLSNLQRKVLARDALVDVATVKLNNRDFNGAAELIKEAKEIKIGKNFLYGDMDSIVSISKINKAIATGMEQDSKSSVPQASKQYVGALSALQRQIGYYTTRKKSDNEDIENSIRLDFENKLNNAYAKNVVDNLLPNSSKESRDYFREKLTAVISAKARQGQKDVMNTVVSMLEREALKSGSLGLPSQILNYSAESIDRMRLERIGKTEAELLGVLSEQDISILEGEDTKEFSEKAYNYFKDFPSSSPRDYMERMRYGSFDATPKIVAAHEKAEKIRELLKTEEYRGIESVLNVEVDAYLNSFMANVLAPELADTPTKRDLQEHEAKLAAFVPGGHEQEEQFRNTAANNIKRKLNILFEQKDDYAPEELNAIIEDLISEEVKEYKVDLEAKTKWLEIYNETAKKVIEKRQGRSAWYYKRASEGDKTYFTELLSDHFGSWWGSDTPKEWEGIEALKEDNMDYAIGYTEETEDFTIDRVKLHNDLKQLRKEDKTFKNEKNTEISAFKTILNLYGYPTFDQKEVVNDLEKIKSDWTEIKLFGDIGAELTEEVDFDSLYSRNDLRAVSFRMFNALVKYDKDPSSLSEKEKADYNLARGLGFFPEDPTSVKESIEIFLDVQSRLIKGHRNLK